MSINKLQTTAVVMMVTAVILLLGCGVDSQERERQHQEAEDKVYAAYVAKDYNRIITLADSFKADKSFSEGKACYWLGYG